MRRFVIFGAVFILVYVIIAALPLNSEFSIDTEYTINLDDTQNVAEAEAETGEEIYPFRLKNYCGYFTPDGKLVSLQAVPYKAAICDSFYSLYSADAENISIINSSGKEQTVLRTAGFPFLQNNRIFVFAPGGNSVAEYTSTGAKRWIYEGYNPITAFNSSQKGAVIGFADGELVCLAPNGDQRFSFNPGGSNYEVIFGADIAKKANLFACLSGIDQQRFLLCSFENSQHKVIFHEFLKKNYKNQAFVHFSDDSNTVYFQYAGGLGVVDCQNLQSEHIAVKGDIMQIAEIKNSDITLVLTKLNSNFYVYLLENTKNLIGDFSFPAESAFILGGDSCFFVGHDDKISKMSITRK